MGPRLLVAHSMGGAIGLVAVARQPDLVQAAVLSAPMFAIKVGSLPAWFVNLVVNVAVATGQSRRFVPGAGIWRPDPGLCGARSHTSSDEERCRVLQAWFEARPELRVDGATYGWVHAALKLGRKIMEPQFLKSVTTPILIGSAGREVFVDPRSHRAAAALLPDCRLVEYPEAKHELFMEADVFRRPWFAAIDAFIRDRLTADGRTLPNAAQ